MNHNQHRTMHDEDPLAGYVDKFVHPDETRTDEQIAYDEHYAIEPWDDNEDDGINPENFEKEVKNPYIITLEKTIKERALAQGMSEADADKIDEAAFTLKDSEGNVTDILKVAISHFKGELSRPGVQGFELRVATGEKIVNGWPVRYVRGSFWGAEQSEGSDCYSMTYDGNSESTRQWVAETLQPEVLATTEVEFHIPEEK